MNSRLALASLLLAPLAALAAHSVSAVSAAESRFPEQLVLRGETFAFEEKGEMKAKALFKTITLCEFGKYAQNGAADSAAASHLLVFRFHRGLSADQVRSVYRGVVEPQPGVPPAELDSFLALLPGVEEEGLLRLRRDSKGKLEVDAGGALLGAVAAPAVAKALWDGLSEEAPKK